MKVFTIILALIALEHTALAQDPIKYKITADSVYITNDCDTAELIVENHTQNVPGFLFNKGRGRTEFRRPLTRFSDTLYTVGIDTLRIPYAWIQGGNAWASTGVLGTKDNNHLDIYTNNVQRARWTNAGNLLIGTNTDLGFKLDVAGPARTGLNSVIGKSDPGTLAFDHSALKIHGNLDVITAPILGENGSFKIYATTTWNRPAATSMKLNNLEVVSYDNRIFFGGANSPYLAIRTGTAENAGGPYTRTRYTVGSDSNPQGWNDSYAWFGVSNSNEFQTHTAYPSRENLYMLETRLNSPIVSSNTGQLAVRAPMRIGARYLQFFTGDYDPGNEALRITETGNVLIATASDNGNKLQLTGNSYFAGAHQVTGNVRFSGLTADNSLSRVLVTDANGNLHYRDVTLAFNGAIESSLAVNGTISAQKMQITQPGAWPDYVFSNQYQLPSLKEVALFIQQNSHLPGIPSAAEVEKKGLDVGETQAGLLKKIEELTLYLIDQEKKLEAQQQQISTLKKQNEEISTLKKQVTELKDLILNRQ